MILDQEAVRAVRDQALAMRQSAALLRYGVPADEALQAIADHLPHGGLQERMGRAALRAAGQALPAQQERIEQASMWPEQGASLVEGLGSSGLPMELMAPLLPGERAGAPTHAASEAADRFEAAAAAAARSWVRLTESLLLFFVGALVTAVLWFWYRHLFALAHGIS